MNVKAMMPTSTLGKRRGMILVVVLVVVAMLSLAAYTFAELMLTHYTASKLGGRQLQSRVLVESGAEAVRLYLLQDDASRDEAGGHFNNANFFQAIPVVMNTDPSDQANFTVIVPNIDEEGNLSGSRYGLEDESTRLNLNALVELDKLQENAGRDLLMGLPSMTEDVADSIMDWIDEDEEAREYGCESEYYQGLTPPYYSKNAPLDTVEELLLVRGVTPQLLFGTDTNRNGMVDTHELSEMTGTAGTAGAAGVMSGATATTDVDTSTGSMDRGWGGYLTLHSQEKNVNALGEPRIDLNMDDLELLYESLAASLNEDWAKFIVLYRQNGAYDGEDAGTDIATVTVDPTQAGENKLGQVLDLIGAKVQASGGGGGGGGGGGETVIAPVFSDSITEMMVYMPLLMDAVTVVAEPVIPGRINVSQAPRAILLGIPGIEETTVDEIINQRLMEVEDEATAAAFEHETWLLTSGAVTLDEMKLLSPFLCAGGDVFRAQIVGYYEDGNSASRAEVIFDATGAVPRIVSFRDISHLGRGYPLELLGLRMAVSAVGGAP